MFMTKLKVVKKRIYKLLKQKLFPLYTGDGAVVDKELQPALKRAHQSTWGDAWRGLDEKVWLSLFRYLNLPIDSKLNQNSKVQRMFRKVLFPQFSKEKRNFKVVWSVTEDGGSIPKLSRGINAQAESPQSQSPKEKPDEGKLFEEDGEISEQNIYTMECLPSKHYPSFKRKKDEEKNDTFGRSPAKRGKFFPDDRRQTFRFPTRRREFPTPEFSAPQTKKNYIRFKPEKSQMYHADAPKMRALLFEPNTLALNYSKVSVPTRIFKDEVLVQVSYSGVCGLDLFITEGKISCGNDAIILGKEISGTVYAVGSDVHHVRPGDKVTVNAFAGCCVCRYCCRGLESCCVKDGTKNSIGVSRNGGWAEFVTVRKTQVHKVPDELALDQAVLVLPLSCILSALSRLNLSYGMKVLVQGLGLSGSLWASVLHRRGFKTVVVSDSSEQNRRQFESLGLDYEFVAPEDVRKLSVDAVIECTGSPASIEKSFDVLNAKGHVCFFGRADPLAEVRCLPHEITEKEITITGSAGNSLCFTEAIDVATSMGQRYLDLKKLGAEVFDLEEFEHAFQMEKSGKVGKIIFKLNS